MATIETNEILSIEDLTKLLNVTTNKLTRLTKKGLPCVTLGGDRKIFLRDSIADWLKAQETPQTNQ